MLIICSTCGGLLTSSSQHRSGCQPATTRLTRRSASMAELTNNCETSLFAPVSNEHVLFAGTLRNWCDPLLQGQQQTPTPLCPRCVTCRCESVRDLPNHQHQRRHDPSCPNFHHHERAKTSSRPRLVNKPKRRANSCDPAIPLNSHTSLIKSNIEHSPSPLPTQRKQSISKIPVRKPSATSSSNMTTTASEYSPSSSLIIESQSMNTRSKIPRPISRQNLSTNNHISHHIKPASLSSSSDEDLDQDSLNDNVHQRTSSMSNHDLSTKKKKKNMMMYCTTTSTNDLDDRALMKKKKTLMASSSTKKQSQSDSSSEKKRRKFWQIEGRHSKSKTAGIPSSPINDLSSTTSSSSSSSSTSNNTSSLNQSRTKSRPYRLASPSQTHTIPSLSDDSLSEQSERLARKRRPRSAFITYESPPRSSRYESTPPPSQSPSVYLIELKNNNHPDNAYGLSKTVTYVWKSGAKKRENEDLNRYPRYSIEQVPPITDQDRHSVPVASRHITLERGKTDYWQNMKTSPDSLLTSSCQKHTGSASNLLLPTLETRPDDSPNKRHAHPNGHVISITTTKRRQPSLLNESQNAQWNVEGDGKQLRYSNLKWYSVDQLQTDHRLVPKHRTKRKQQTSDSATDTGSSSDQHNQSAPPILQHKSNVHLTNEIHEVLENIPMSKQNDSMIPDYSLFHREINNTSSPINDEEERQQQQQQQRTDSSSSSSSSSAKQFQHFETIINENSSQPPKPIINPYASTDEDVDESYLDDSVDADRPIETIQTYRDRLNARINPEMNSSRPRLFSMEHSQITHDSGVDILSEQRPSRTQINEHSSEQTPHQHESDDSLLDIETTRTNELVSKSPPPIIHEQSISFTDESEEGKTYLTALTDHQLLSRTERGFTNTSEQYYSAESEFNTSLSFPTNDPFSGYELENVSDDDESMAKAVSPPPLPPPPPPAPRSPSPKFDFKLPTFGDWIDQVFTNFLAETNQQTQSASTSRSSSIISIHTSQNTIDSSSSQMITVIENTNNNRNVTIISKNPIEFDENNSMHSSHRRSLSWPNEQQDEQRFKDTSSSSLDDENIDFNMYNTPTYYENINSNQNENANKQSKSLHLSSIENNDEEVINKETMQNDYFHHHLSPQTTSIDRSHSEDEKFSFTNPTTNIDAAEVEEKERGVDEKHFQMEDEDKPLIQVAVTDDSSNFSFYEEFPYRESQQQQAHTDSHDSLLQPDHHTMDPINTTASSTDDLSMTHQLSSSVFHSKDSALGLSDDNLNLPSKSPFMIMDDDDDDDDNDDDHHHHEQKQTQADEEDDTVSSSLLPIQDNQTDENNVIRETTNNNIDKNEMTYESNTNNNTMIWINDQPPHLTPSLLSPPSYFNERTTSSSSSEQLIPKEKQTGMYLPAFGSSAAIHLAEKYNCEWLQDVTTPTSNTRKSSSIVDNDDSRVIRRHQSIGDDDEFVVTFQTLQPSYSAPNLTSLITHEPLRERSYSLTTLDAYARLDITRDTLEQMWLSLLDLAFSDKEDIELGEYRLRHIRGLSKSYSNMNETIIEKSRSHGDIFSTANRNEQFTAKKSKSFDTTTLSRPINKNNDPANVGLLEGAAVSEPFVDRICSISNHSDTEPNLLDFDNDSIQSLNRDNSLPQQQDDDDEEDNNPPTLPLPPPPPSQIDEISSPVIKEPLTYIFRNPHQLYNTDDEYDLEESHDINNYLPETTLMTPDQFGDEDREIYTTVSSDYDEAPAVIRDTQTELANYRPHSLSTIPSSRASEYNDINDDSDEIIDHPGDIRRSTISNNQDEDFSLSEHSENKQAETGSNTPSSSIQSRSRSHSPDPNQRINYSDIIDHRAWEISISEPIYVNDSTNLNSHEEDFFTFTDNLTRNILRETIEQARKSPQNNQNQSKESNFIDFSSQEDSQDKMDSRHEDKSSNSTHTSLSSIHDTHLNAAELAHRLAELGRSNSSSPPKPTFAEELAELENRFDLDSLNHSPVEKPRSESILSTPHTYSTTPPIPLQIDELTSIAKDIRDRNQEKSVSSLCTIVEDIHAQTNNQFLTKIVDYHQSPPISNLKTIVTELHQTPIGKSVPRPQPQRPTHLELHSEEEEEEEEEEDIEEEIQSPVVIESIPIPSNIVSDLKQQFASYQVKTPSPPSVPSLVLPTTRRISEPPAYAPRYHTQRIDKVSDLEIVKQGKGFKIGYVDRQGTDQRVILTKRIEAGPDIMARDPHIRQPYKGRKLLSQVYSSVLYTNGYNTIQEDQKFRHSANDIEVPVIGTNPRHFDESDMVSIDIDGPSTMLNSICESIVITQGSVYTTNSPKSSIDHTVTQPISKSIFDHNLSHSSSSSSSRLRHVVLDHHEEYLLDSSRTPTPSSKKDKIEVIDTWQDRTEIDGSSTTWRSPSLPAFKATKHIQSTNTAEPFVSNYEPNTIQTRIVPSHDAKYRTSKHIEIPSVYDWNEETIDTPRKHSKTTRDIALSPILIEKKQYQTSSTSPRESHQKVDRSCQYSPPVQHDRGLQCHFDNLTSSTQVSSHDIPNFLITDGGTQTIHDSNPPFDDSGIHTQVHTISPALSVASSETHQATQPFTLSGSEFIRKLDEQRARASTLTVTQYTDGNYYLPLNDNHQATTNLHPVTLERSADSGILVDEQLSRHRPTKANFALQVDIKSSSSDSEDVSEVTQRPVNRLKPPTNGDLYEHHSELLITTRSSSKSRQNSSSNDKRYDQPRTSSPREIEQQILQLRRERAHIMDLLSLNWTRSNIWVELTEAKLNYIIGETDALLRSLSFDATTNDNERVKSKVHQYEEEMAELTRQRLAVYRERLEDSKKQLDIKIDELELKKSTAEQSAPQYSTLEYIPRVNTTRTSKSFLSTSAENLTNIPLQDTISTHPQLLDVSFLSTPNQDVGLPPRYPRSPRFSQQQQQSSPDTYRTVYRPTPRYPSASEHRYDYPRYRTTSYVTPSGNLSGMQGLSKSQQAILDETDRLVRDSQQFHHESASQFERARESLLSSETPIRLARANMAASRLSPNTNYLPNDVTLAELFKYEQSLAKETAKNTRTYSTISTSAES